MASSEALHAAVKRASDADQHYIVAQPPTKAPKLEHGSSSAASPQQPRRRNQNPHPSRTGQACDRCKARKIRCDDTDGGCMPCRQNNTECRTTDRITQRATVRGHTEAIERENAYLHSLVQDLRQQLRAHDIEPKPASNGFPLQDQQWQRINSPTTPHAPKPTTAPPTAPTGHHRSDIDSNIYALPAYRPGSAGENYLGVVTDNPLLSQPKGTSLTLFGVAIDVSDYVYSDWDDNYIMSYDGFHDAIYSPHKPSPAKASSDLPPSYEEYLQYAQWYMGSINVWMPTLHPPHFLDMVRKLYHEKSFEPSAAETVMVQMVLATMKFHLAQRNGEPSHSQSARAQASAHYWLALTHWSQLEASRKIADLQAMAMICAHVRCFPKPGAAWKATYMTIACAIEIGLHRSAKVWPNELPNADEVTLEMRKRIFWTALMLHISVSGKLGRPVSLLQGTYDIEFPEPMHDTTLEDGTTYCSFEKSIPFLKLAELFNDTYNKIYAVRFGTDYEAEVRRLDAALAEWKQKLPASVNISKPEGQELANRPFANWASFWEAEFMFVLHHPALCRSSSPEYTAKNLDVCMTAASTIIQSTAALRATKSLDCTWINITTYVGALFTCLFGHWTRRDLLNSTLLKRLQVDIDACLGILEDVGGPLGTGNALRDSVAKMAASSLEHMNRYLVEKTAQTASVAVANSAGKQEESNKPIERNTSTSIPNGQSAYQSNYEGADIPQNPSSNYNSDAGIRNVPQTSAGYHGTPQRSYPPPTPDEAAHFSYQSPYGQPINNYAVGDNLQGRGAVSSEVSPVVYAREAASQVEGSYSGSANEWQQWADMNKDGYRPQDYVSSVDSANALMALNGQGGAGSDMAPVPDAAAQGTASSSVQGILPSNDALKAPTVTQPWPMSAGYLIPQHRSGH